MTLKSALVVLFDDLHWADDSSLQLLLHLAPHLGSMRLLLVGTYRDVELDTERPFAKTLETLLRQRLATRIQVKRLTAAGVEQMLHRLSGTSPPSSLVRVLHQETDGNPFFVEEVYQHLAEERKLFDASGVWKPNLRAEEIDVPEGVRLVISRRLQRLGDEARRVLSAAAIIGRSFPLDLLGAVADAPEDTILDVVEQAERARLVVAERSRDTRYAFVHELIRSTLINNLSLPRRQRLHLKIADVLERLRAASLESHASVLAHHLYQAGAAVESGRTAKFLLLAGRRALTAGAFEETLETCDQVLGLELPEHDPRLGEASEHRGQGLTGLQRHDDAIAAFDRALAIYSAGGDDAGIERAASGAANCYVWRGRSAEGAASLARGLNALSKGAARERALLLAWFAASRMSPAHIDEAWQSLDEAIALAEHVADPAVLERALIGKSYRQRMCFEHEASTATARQALSLPHNGSLWDRVDLLVGLVTCQFYLGRFANCEELLPELEAAAGRAGHHGALWVGEYIQRWIGAHRTGDLRGLLEHTEQALGERYFWYFSRTTVGLCGLYLGAVDQALAQLESVVVEQPSDFWAQGMPDANLFAATALSGQRDRARSLIPTVVPWLPVSGRRNVQGAFVALEAFVTGLTLTGDRDHCSTLYPLTLDYIHTGQVCAGTIVGPGNPQLAAALAADAAGLADQSRDHFETALRQAREVPMRMLQPTVLYWYGWALSAAPGAGDWSRGRAMVEAALADFRTLGMVLHANLAGRFLRDGR